MSEQRLTSISRMRFMELIRGIEDGSLVKRWADGKEPVTKKERVEARQISALATWINERGMQKIRELLERDDWRELEFVTDGHGVQVRLHTILPTLV